MELKEQGNAFFKDEEFIQAKSSYEGAFLKLLKEENQLNVLLDSESKFSELSINSYISVILDDANAGLMRKVFSQERKQLVISILTNIAACCLKLNSNEECIKYCDVALTIDENSIKALYRKAQAYANLKKYFEAAKFAKILVEKDPENMETKRFLLEIKKIVEEKGSTTNQALDLVLLIEKDFDDKVQLDAATFKNHERILVQLLGSLIDDQVLAKSLCLQGLAGKIWKLMETYPVCSKIIRKLVDYKDCNIYLLTVLDPVRIFKLVLDLQNDVPQTLGGEEIGALIQATMTLYMNKEMQVKFPLIWNSRFGSLEAGSGVDLSSLGLEGIHILEADMYCLTLCIMSFKAKDEDVKKFSIESLIRFVGASKHLASTFVKDCNGLSALLTMITPDRTPVRSKDASKEEAEFKKLRTTIQQVAIILGRILPTLDDDNLIKSYGIGFTVPALKSDDLFEQMKGCAALNAIFIANLELGIAIAAEGDSKILDLLFDLGKSAPAKTQGLICEIFANMANHEKGRDILKGDEKFSVLLNVLVHSDTINVRTNASITLAKLNATKFDKDSNQGTVVMSSVFSLLESNTTEEEKSKGVEAISYVINDTDVKMMMCTKSEGLKVLKTLVKLAVDNKDAAKAAYAFGLAHIFENLSMSEDDKRREKLREMEVSQEQWEQFQKLTKTQTEGHKPDPPENVALRSRAFIANNGAAALRSLVLNGGSERVRESIARTYCNLAVVQEVRGQMFSQGAARALIDLTSEKEDKSLIEGVTKAAATEREKQTRLISTKKLAAHALAKMFITTDPNLVGFTVVMDSLKCLVDNLKLNDEELIAFETCMALTNLITVSHEVKRKVINLGAIKLLEYISYSEDLLVRRSACECLSNLVPEREMIDWFMSGNIMKLWLMFASAYEEDLKISEACLGALAGVCFEPEISKCIDEQEDGKGLATLVVLLMSNEPSIIHRDAVCLLGVLDSLEDAKAKLRHFKIDDAIARAEQIEDLPPAVQEILVSLKQALE